MKCITPSVDKGTAKAARLHADVRRTKVNVLSIGLLGWLARQWAQVRAALPQLRQLILVPLVSGMFSCAAAADEATPQDEGLRAFIQTCVLGAPDFKNGEAKFRRLGFPLLDFEATKALPVSKDSPEVWAVWGKMKNSPDGRVCGVLLRGGDTRPVVPTLKKYADSPDFPYKGRRAGLRFFGTGVTPTLSREYQLPDGRMLIFVVSSDYTYLNAVGELTMMLAMVGTPAKR